MSMKKQLYKNIAAILLYAIMLIAIAAYLAGNLTG